MNITKVKMLQATLSWLNDTFVSAVGMKPLEDLPTGYQADSKSCVIANALNTNAPLKNGHWSVTHNGIELVCAGESEYWEVPVHVSSFIDQFDDGFFPDYVSADSIRHDN